MWRTSARTTHPSFTGTAVAETESIAWRVWQPSPVIAGVVGGVQSRHKTSDKQPAVIRIRECDALDACASRRQRQRIPGGAAINCSDELFERVSNRHEAVHRIEDLNRNRNEPNEA